MIARTIQVARTSSTTASITILFGAFLSPSIGSPIGAIVVLALVKTALDLELHLREHRGPATRLTAA